MSNDRAHVIFTAFITAFAGRSVREADPTETFHQLAERVPNLTTAELVSAADQAKVTASELRSLAHRIERAAEFERRRAGQK
jgi:hypothetical protein